MGSTPHASHTPRWEHEVLRSSKWDVLKWARDLPPTKSGRVRGAAIYACGRPSLTQMKDGTYTIVHKFCRDRACPSCQKRRSREMKAEVRAALAIREDAVGEGRFLFLTLTQPKIKGESAKDAIDRLMKTFQKLKDPGRKSGREFYEVVSGGIRTMEVTWSRGSGYWGFHAHFHCLVELRDGVSIEDGMAKLPQMWVDRCKGAKLEIV